VDKGSTLEDFYQGKGARVTTQEGLLVQPWFSQEVFGEVAFPKVTSAA